MSLTVEEQQLVLKVEGTLELERLNRELEKEQTALRDTVKAGVAAAGGQAAYEAAVSKSAAEIARLHDEQKKAADAAASLTAAQAATGAGATTAAGGVAALKAQVAASRAEQKALNADFAAGKIAVDQYLAATQRLTASAAPARSALASLGQGTGDYRQNVTALGYALNDFFSVQGSISQRLNAIANNIPGVLAGLGGVGLALGAIVPIIGMVIQNWDHLVAMFGGGVDEMQGHLAGLKGRIKELEEKPHLIPIETAELLAAKALADGIVKSLEAAERLRTSQTRAERESGKAVEEAVTEGGVDVRGEKVGGAEVYARLRKDMVNELLASDDKLRVAIGAENATRARIAELDKQRPTSAGAAQQLIAERAREEKQLAADRAAQTERQTAITKGVTDKGVFTPAVADQQLGKILEDAQKKAGAAQLAAQEALAKRLEQAGLRNQAAQVRASTPELIEGYEGAEEDRKAGTERAKREKGEADRAEAERLRANRNVEADREREFNEAKAGVRREGDAGAELAAGARADLAGGTAPGQVRARVKASIRAELDRADKVREEIRDAVAEAVSGEIVGGIGPAEVARAKAAGETRAAHDRKAAAAAGAKVAADLSKATDVDEQAAALTRQVREAGGVYDPARDRVRPMTPEQQQAYIRREVFDYLRRMGVGAQQAQMAAGPIANKAFGDEGMAELAARAPQPGRRPAGSPFRAPTAPPRAVRPRPGRPRVAPVKLKPAGTPPPAAAAVRGPAARPPAPAPSLPRPDLGPAFGARPQRFGPAPVPAGPMAMMPPAPAPQGPNLAGAVAGRDRAAMGAFGDVLGAVHNLTQVTAQWSQGAAAARAARQATERLMRA